MSQRNRLGFLQVSETRHESVYIFFHDAVDHFHLGFQQIIDGNDLIPDVQFHIQCSLVVTAASGVKFFTGVTNAFDQIGLYKCMDIFMLHGDLQSTIFDVLEDPLQTVHDLLTLIVGQNALFGKHGNMCDTAENILFVEFLVISNGCVKIVY